MNEHILHWPADAGRLSELHSGDLVYLSGTIYTARDAAHRRLVELLRAGEEAPVCLEDSAIFYAGPSPCPPGRVCGSIGPTTSSRMEIYKEDMMKAGMKLMIGKGASDPGLPALCHAYGAAYLVALGGVAALTARCIRSMEVVAWPDLGAEAIRRLRVERLPLVVVNDIYGNDYFLELTQAREMEE